MSSAITRAPGCHGPGPLVPGVDRCLTFTIRNLLTAPITVTAVSISSVGAQASCPASNLDLGRTALAGAVTVPGGGTVAAPGGRIALRDTATNQDACKGASFTFTLTGTARVGADSR